MKHIRLKFVSKSHYFDMIVPFSFLKQNNPFQDSAISFGVSLDVSICFLVLLFINHHTFIQPIKSRINKRVTYPFTCINRMKICILLTHIPQFKS